MARRFVDRELSACVCEVQSSTRVLVYLRLNSIRSVLNAGGARREAATTRLHLLRLLRATGQAATGLPLHDPRRSRVVQRLLPGDSSAYTQRSSTVQSTVYVILQSIFVVSILLYGTLLSIVLFKYCTLILSICSFVSAKSSIGSSSPLTESYWLNGTIV